MRVRWNGGEILSPGMWSMGIKNTYYCSVRMLKSYAGRVQRNCRYEMVGLSSIFVARRLGQHIVGLGRRQLIIVACVPFENLSDGRACCCLGLKRFAS
jgi:hypothetical protein